MLAPGAKLPDFSLVDQDGKARSLRDYAERWLVLYVYPKDDTPGCTLQGQSFTATRADFDALATAVVGLSADDAASHRRFCDKYGFKIDLLADPQGSLLGALGVGQSDWQGQKFWNRTTFVVDPRGVVRKVYDKVDPRGHEAQLLSDLKALGAGRT